MRITINHSRDFYATPAAIWNIIQDPANMPAWNPKCVRCDHVGRARLGNRFEVEYIMNGKPQVATGEVIHYEPERELVFAYLMQGEPNIGRISESLKLVPREQGVTRLMHQVDFTESTLPRWVKGVIWLIDRVGKRVGPDALEGIEDLLPAGHQPPPVTSF